VNGNYSSHSAYEMQFHGSHTDYEWHRVWSAKVQTKCKLFVWLLLQNRLWTADRLNNHGRQTNTICRLCHTHAETALHMMASCPFARSIWQGLQAWLGTGLRAPPAQHYRRLKNWWSRMTKARLRRTPERTQKIIYTAWNIWKE
jgi:hypothetical protein